MGDIIKSKVIVSSNLWCRKNNNQGFYSIHRQIHWRLWHRIFPRRNHADLCLSGLYRWPLVRRWLQTWAETVLFPIFTKMNYWVIVCDQTAYPCFKNFLWTWTIWRKVLVEMAMSKIWLRTGLTELIAIHFFILQCLWYIHSLSFLAVICECSIFRPERNGKWRTCQMWCLELGVGAWTPKKKKKKRKKEKEMQRKQVHLALHLTNFPHQTMLRNYPWFWSKHENDWSINDKLRSMDSIKWDADDLSCLHGVCSYGKSEM